MFWDLNYIVQDHFTFAILFSILARGKGQILPTHKERGLYKGRDTRRWWSLGVILGSVPNTEEDVVEA